MARNMEEVIDLESIVAAGTNVDVEAIAIPNDGQLVLPRMAGQNTQILQRIIIRPASGWRLVNLRELWQYRDLLYFLTWRDVKVRYKQTALGAAWAILQPALMMVVFSVFFGRMAGVDSDGFPYPLFAFCGLLPWTFFATAIANAGNSVIGSERLITKVYFPRLAVPFASVSAALVDFVVALAMLVALLFWYQIRPTWSLLLVPPLMALFCIAALGTGSLLAALNVSYRDFRYVIPFLVQLWMFATPTIYMQPTDGPGHDASGMQARAESEATPKTEHRRSDGAVPDGIQHLLNLNPMTGLVAAFRAAVVGKQMPWPSVGWSSLGAATMFVFGCFYFRRAEDSFADII